MTVYFPIPDFPNYKISKEGKIISLCNFPKIRELKICNDSDKYQIITLSKNNKRITKKIHRLVAQVFLKSWDANLTVNHKDGNKSNNNISNLEMMTCSENLKHAHNNSITNTKGENNGRAKLTERDVLRIKKFLKYPNMTLKEIADIYNITSTQVSWIRDGKSWRHVK